MHIPDQESRGHISKTRVYYLVGTALLVLTVVTVGASYIDWGSTLINVLIALFIATIKASLVILFFMHMKYEDRFVWGYGIIYPAIIFAIMVGFISLDIFQRVQVIPTP
ncbi:MAG: cytochrome C oxidase subunit IV family protein [Leptospirales bacterium]|nr:cytochrome C oxidase subunit IV family protein [Leptospirales bacterium]